MKKDREHVPVRESGALCASVTLCKWSHQEDMKLSVICVSRRSVVVLSASLRALLSPEGSLLLGPKLSGADE